jgi:hypothetical protein
MFWSNWQLGYGNVKKKPAMENHQQNTYLPNPWSDDRRIDNFKEWMPRHLKLREIAIVLSTRGFSMISAVDPSNLVSFGL